MRAYRLLDWQQPGFADVPVPEPGAGQVLVRVAGVGLCHSDVLFLESPAGVLPYDVPFTLGHEIAGWVATRAPDFDDLGDGVVATRVMPDIHLIPGFWKIDGYSKLKNYVTKTFDVKPGENLFEFAYDWRRDNRVSARKLQRSADDWLKSWRESSGNKDAKLILVGHSMGGVISRY